MTQTTAIDLSKYDFELIIDKSGSMSETDCPGGRSRWQWCQEQTEAVARTMQKYDSDGITVSVFNGLHKTYENVTPEKVHQIFTENSPSGNTDTAGILKARLQAYRERVKHDSSAKPLILAVITDGEPNDQQAVKDVIIEHTKWMHADEQTGISFMQVGKCASARNYLKNLDNGLESAGAKFDIVNTQTFEELENLSIEDALILSLTD